MWIPEAFRESDRAVMHDLIEAHSFATLVSVVGGVPFATHLPFLLDRERGAEGTLVGHVARANPHWKALAGEVLVVFRGPHAYVSPAWYEERDTVPTWNYAAVHAYGQAELVHEPARLRAIVERLTRVNEERAGTGWSLGADVERQLRWIVGLEIPIRRLEGKLKLNQNRSLADRLCVVRALSRAEDPAQRGVADWMLRGFGEAAAAGGAEGAE